ncbi:MAG: oligosaccharide flippase family protein, partial [Anaerolineae bacterium]
IVAKVVFPVFSKIREDADALSRGFLQTARYVSLVTVPIGLGIALLSRPFILVVFGQKWIEAAPVMSCIAIYGVMLSLGFNAGDVYKAQGRPGILTRISIVQLCVLLPALYWAVTVMRSLVSVGLVQVGVATLGSVINLVVAVRLLHLTPGRMLEAFRPAILAGAALLVAVGAVLLLTRGAISLVPLIAGTLAGGAAYAGWLWFVDRSTGAELLQLARMVLRRS